MFGWDRRHLTVLGAKHVSNQDFCITLKRESAVDVLLGVHGDHEDEVGVARQPQHQVDLNLKHLRGPKS